MAKQEHKILEFHGGTNSKMDPRDIADNQNIRSALSISRPGKLTAEGSALTLYDKTNINGKTINDVGGASGGFESGYGLFAFSHDYDMDSTPDEVDTEFIVTNDKNDIDIYDPNKSGGAGWRDASFTLGSRTSTVKPEFYNVDGALRACDVNFEVTDVTIDTNAEIGKNDVVLTTESGTIATGSTIQIEQEIMYVTSGSSSGTSITVIRGFANTKAVTHLTNQDIYYVNVPKYFGHIKQDRLFEANTSNSINTWVEDVQTPQPPNNTRKSDGTTGTLANSAGVQSLRVYDIEEASTSNYPTESEKVVLEFGESPAGTGIIKVSKSGDTVTFTTSGYGNDPNATHRLSTNSEITLSNMHDNLSVYNGPHTVTGTTSTTFSISFSEAVEELDATGALYYADADAGTAGFADLGASEGATFPNSVQVNVNDSSIPFLDNTTDPPYGQYNETAYVHLTGQTGVIAFNGVQLAYLVDANSFRFENASHGSVADVSGTTKVQQLIGLVAPVDSGDIINQDLKRKWNFAMSFTYDGPGQEVQESLLTMGHSLTPSVQSNGLASNLINVADASELVQDGADTSTSNWQYRDAAGNVDGWTDANPSVYADDETASIINTLAGSQIELGLRYKLTFTVGTAGLNLAIGGAGQSTGGSADETFVAAANYAAGTHTVSFQAAQDWEYLWITATTSSAGNGSIDDVSLKNSGYGSGATEIVVDDGAVFSVNDVIMIGTEQILITDVSTHTLTVSRGHNSTTAAHFANDSAINLQIKELSPTATVDWTNFVGAPKCVIKTLYNYGVDEQSWNPRINGFKIYMKDVTEEDASKEFRLFAEINFNKGTYILFGAGDSELILEQPGTWSSDGKVCTVSTGTEITIKPIDTYLSENLFTEQTIIDAQYKASCVAGRKVYIGNIKQGGRTYPDRMLRTPVNKFDTFPETNFIDVAIGDGDSIIALESFGDRIIQFKKKNVYIINISGDSEVLESEYSGNGISFPSQVVKTSLGIAWITAQGLWFFDGQQAVNLTNFLHNDYTLGTTDLTSPRIAYEPKSNRLIYTNQPLSGPTTKWYYYDLNLKAYSEFSIGCVIPGSASADNYYTSFVNDSNGDLIIGFVDDISPTELNIYKWDEDDKGQHPTGAGGSILWKSKDIDFGSPATNKKIHKIYVTYSSIGHSGVKMRYATNGSGSFSEFKDSSNYYSSAGGFQSTNTGSYPGTSRLWQVAELKPLSSINNIKSIQLSFDTTIIGIGDVRGGSTTTSQLASALGSTDYTNYNLYHYAGPSRYNSRRIESYNTSTQTATLTAFTDKGYGDTPTTDTDYLLGSISAGFEINDITIIYRPKRVK